MSCPTFDDLLSWHERPEQDLIGGHVGSGCPDCRRRLDLLSTMFTGLSQPEPPVVSPSLRAATLRQLDRLDAAPSSGERLVEALGATVGKVQEWIAELIELPRAPALSLGLRGDDDAGLRRYAAGPWRLDVGLIERRSLMGQLLDGADADAVALAGATCVLCGNAGSRETQVDDDGAFRFEAVGPGRYGLMIEAADQRLLFPDVDLVLPGD